MQKIISILTGWGAELGTGHIQRMTTLYHHISQYPDITARLVAPDLPRTLAAITDIRPESTLHSESVLILRDMRDSSTEEMLKLQATAPVLAIDDLGPGRDAASLVLDLLPNIPFHGNKTCRDDLYLYGYSFMRSLQDLRAEIIEKDIDLVFYTGLGASSDYLSFLQSLVPSGHSAILLTGGEPVFYNIDQNKFRDTGYAEYLARARVFVSHFGISLYEAHISGCRLISLNPSEYHSSLADIASASLGLINLGVYNTIDAARERSKIGDILKKSDAASEPDKTLGIARQKAEACAAYIHGLIT